MRVETSGDCTVFYVCVFVQLSINLKYMNMTFANSRKQQVGSLASYILGMGGIGNIISGNKNMKRV